MKPWASAVAVIVGVLVGLVAGIGLGRRMVAPPSEPPALSKPSQPTDNWPDLIAERDRPSPPPIASSPPPAQGGRMTIPVRLLKNLTFPCWDEAYQLTPDIGEALQLTDGERNAVQAALGKTRRRLDELELAHSKIVSNAPGSVVIAVEPFVEAGQQVRRELEDDVRTALGEGRAQLFHQFAGSAKWEEDFACFGRSQQKISLSRDKNGLYHIESSYVIRDETSTESGGRSNSAKVLPGRFRGLFEEQP